MRPILLGYSADLIERQGDLAGATRLLDEAWRISAPEQSDSAYYSLNQQSYRIYKKAGRFELALKHLEALKEISDHNMTVAASTNSALMAARFDFANQDLRIARLKAGELRRDVALAHAKQRQSFIVLMAVLLLSAAILLFLLIYIRSVRRSRNAVRAVNDDLTRSNAALEKALIAKSQFLATTSHEIRTPLNGILGMTQVMLADPSAPAEVRERVGLVHSAGETMRALVDDILDLAKMETGRLVMAEEPIALRTMLSDAARFWRDRAEAKGVALALDLADCPDRVLGDEPRMRQILFNLLANAIKFTLEGEVRLSASISGEAEAERLLIKIQDSGIGIPAEGLEVIFEKFHQLDGGTTRRFGGTGLGLAISRNLAEAMGGTIQVESVLDIGSTFTVDLPLRRAPALPVPAEAERPQGRILVAGANLIGRSVLKAMLETRFERLEFVDPAEVGPVMRDRPIDLLLVDGGGFQAATDDDVVALTELAATAHAAGAGSLLLWAGETGGAVQNCGFGSVLRKPVAADTLVSALNRTIDRKSGISPLASAA